MNRHKGNSVFEKHYPSPRLALEAARRTQLALNAGVRTPMATHTSGASMIQFHFVEGSSGVGLLQETPLVELLASLRTVHCMQVDGLRRFDPFLRIDPRMRQHECPAGLTEMVNRLRPVSFSNGGAVHGDFHFGQLIKQASGEIWLVDLDDLAVGPPEVDLGNLIAHLSTHSATCKDTLPESLNVWGEQVLSAWAERGGSVEPNLLNYFTQVSVIRRAMKQLEQGSDRLIHRCLKHYASTNHSPSR